MFDIGATELLLIIVVAVIVIGPKELPLALRTAGRWIGKMRRVSGHFRAGLDAMVREAEMEDMQKEWDRRNAEIMAKHPNVDAETGTTEPASLPEGESEPAAPAAKEANAAKPSAEPAMEALPLFDEARAETSPDGGKG